VQLDGEKPDKITRGACACNDDKVIFENLSLACGGHMSEYATIHPLGWLFTDSKKLGEPDGSPCCLIDQIVFAADSARTLILRADGGLQGAAAGDDAHGGYWFLRAGVCELRLFLRSVHAKR
jgi:hypothetical protein